MENELILDFTKCSNIKNCESLLTDGLLGDPIFPSEDSEKHGNAICVIPNSEEELVSRLKQTHSGTVMRWKNSPLREINKADKKGLFCEWFNYFNHIDEIVDINRSKNVRGGKKLSNFYVATRSDFGPELKKQVPIEKNLCDYHQIMYWGVFEPEATTNPTTNIRNKKLVGYIRAFRLNDFVWYNMIIGHGSYLKFGVMHKMHTDLLKHYFKSPNPPKYIAYGPANIETNQWKRKALFENSKVHFKALYKYYKEFDESYRKRFKKDISTFIELGEYSRAEILIRILRFYPRRSLKSKLTLQTKRILKNNFRN